MSLALDFLSHFEILVSNVLLQLFGRGSHVALCYLTDTTVTPTTDNGDFVLWRMGNKNIAAYGYHLNV